jgi:hypothetical protein
VYITIPGPGTQSREICRQSGNLNCSLGAWNEAVEGLYLARIATRGVPAASESGASPLEHSGGRRNCWMPSLRRLKYDIVIAVPFHCQLVQAHVAELFKLLIN